MSKRERNLALIVGLCLVLGGGLFGARKLNDALRARRAQIASLEKSVRTKTHTVRLSMAASDRLQDYQRRSLPADLEAASSLYQTWLLSVVKEVGLKDTQVNVLPMRNEKDVYYVLGSQVSGRGDLPRLVSFLHQFYSADLLHRIRRLHVKRVPGTRELDLSLAIEAVSLTTADSMDKLNDQQRQLVYGDRDAYLEVILQRNLLGPANKAPVIEALREQVAHVGETVSFTVRAQDPDKLDQVSYRLDGAAPEGATLDARSGTFRWTAAKPGTYRVVVAATDDGFPPQTAQRTVDIRIDEKPPEAPSAPVVAVSKPSFNLAKFAYVTAITEADGKRLVWISLRTEGRLLKLSEGEEFQIGEVTVKVHRITDRDVELDAPILERRLLVTLGQNIGQGRDLDAAEG